MPKKILAEGIEYIYYSIKDGIPSSYANLEIWGIPDNKLWVNIIQPEMIDFRAVIITSALIPNVGAVYYLHWDDTFDLETLDQKVTKENYTSGDFYNSIKTQFDITHCNNCHWEGYTLIIPTGDPYYEMPELGEQKLKRRFQKDGILRCPKCGESLRQLVVKILSKRKY